MSLFTQSKRRRAHAPAPAKSTAFRPALESLDDRIVPALHTWQGPAGGAWNNGAHWVGGVPASNEPGGTIVVFGNDGSSSSNMNIPNLRVDEMTFEGNQSFTLTLSENLRLAGGVNAVVLTAPQVNIIGTGDLVLQAGDPVGFGTNNASLFMLIGADTAGPGSFAVVAGDVRITGNLSHTGATQVVAGEMQLFSDTTVLPQTITVGDGDGNAGTASLVVSNDMTIELQTVNVDSDGEIVLNPGAILTINDLSLEGSGVGGQGLLVLTDTLNTTASAATANIGVDTKLSGFLDLNVQDGTAAADVNFSQAISGFGSATIRDGGTVRLSGNEDNTYAGTFSVKGGTLELGKTEGKRAVGTLQIGNTLPDVQSVVRLVTSNQISDTNHVSIGLAGTFDLNGKNETVTDVTVSAGGKITTADGDLTSLGVVSLAAGDVQMGPNGKLILTSGLTATGFGGDNSVQIQGGTIDATGGLRNLTVIGVNSFLEVTSKLSNGSFVKTGSGHLRWSATSPAATPIQVTDGKLTVDATAAAADITLGGGILSGTGKVDTVVATGGTIQPVAPGDTPLNTGDLTANGATTFRMNLNGPNQSVRINAAGAVNLGGAQLSLNPLVALPAGTTYEILTNDGADPILGTFAGLPEGSLIQANGQTFRITYAGGANGNDIVLTRLGATTTTLVNPDAGDHVRAGATIGLSAMTNGGLGGTVEFYDGNTLLGSATVQGLGFAFLSATLGEGMHSLSAKYLGDADSAPSESAAVNVEAVPELYAVGAGAGGAPLVTIYNADGTARSSVNPFPNTFLGGVRTATADVNGDGFPDIIAGTGPGIATQVKVFDGRTGTEIFSVAPFEAAFTGGVYVAAGDVNGDGYAEVAITPDEGGGPRVKVISGKNFSTMADFFGIDDAAFRGGARAGFADMNGDGRDDLLVAAGFGGGPRVAGFDGAALAQGDTTKKLFPDFFAFEQALRNGVFLTGGDFDGDGLADLAAGGGPGGGPRVSVFDGKQLLQSGTPVAVANFFAGDPNNRGGVRLGVKQLTSDDAADLVTGSGTGGGSRVTAYDAGALLKGSTEALHQFDAFPGFAGGVYVG